MNAKQTQNSRRFMMAENEYDLMIVGAGPAGLTAAIYGQRLGMKTVVFGDVIGGSLYRVENHPGFSDNVSGTQFGMTTFSQAREQGAFFPMARLNLLSHDGDQFMGIGTDSRQYFAPAALVATGVTPKTLGVPKENEKGIFHSSLCAGSFLRNKNATVGVIGGGNMAGQEALSLSRFAGQIILLHRDEQLCMEAAIREAIEKKGNIFVLSDTQVVSFVGDTQIDGILVIIGGDEKRKIRVNGVFMAMGWEPNLKMLKIPVETTSEGFIKTDERLMSSFPGLFAAGDVRDTDMRQVITACADGARVAAYAVRFIEN